jgi:cobalt-zinc-cadmium efflux system membrane fusion protein
MTTTPDTEQTKTTAPNGSTTTSEATGNTAAKTRRWRWATLIAGAGLAIGVVAYATNSVDKPTTAAAEPPDVPHVEGDRIVFSEAFATRIGIERAPVKLAPLTPVVSVVGTVTFNPEHMAAVGTRLRGLVRMVHKFEGDEVKQGDLLATVESAELGEAQAAVTTLEAERRAAEINAERERQLKEKQLSTAREYEVAQTELQKYAALLHAARQRVAALGSSADGQGVIGLGRHAVRSPISGTLIERHVSTGQSVEADLVAFRVANLDHLWVELAVFERNLDSIRVGDAVVLSPLANPDERMEGRIAHIAAQIDPDTRSADVRIALDNTARKLRPGQAVTAEIEASKGAHRPVLMVPNTAVTVIDGQPTVFVSDGETSVRTVPVELGVTNGDQQQIIKGLEEGQTVVSRGVFALKSELFR